MFAGIVYVVAITTQDANLTLTGQAFLPIVIGGLWAILSGVIFPATKFLKRHTTDQSVQEQCQEHPEAKLTDKTNSNFLQAVYPYTPNTFNMH